MSDEPPRAGRIARSVAAEFPELALWRLDVDALSGRSPDEVRERLRDLSNPFRAAFDREALEAGDQPDQHAEKHGFEQPDYDVAHEEAADGGVKVEGGHKV